MSYFVYFLFTVWFLSGLGGLLAGALIRFGPADAPRVSPRPAWFQFATGFFTLTIASVLLWLYQTETITGWWVFALGTVVLLPEIIYFLFSRRQIRRAA
jgi:CDP-diglyceride synthetase